MAVANPKTEQPVASSPGTASTKQRNSDCQISGRPTQLRVSVGKHAPKASLGAPTFDTRPPEIHRGLPTALTEVIRAKLRAGVRDRAWLTKCRPVGVRATASPDWPSPPACPATPQFRTDDPRCPHARAADEHGVRVRSVHLRLRDFPASPRAPRPRYRTADSTRPWTPR